LRLAARDGRGADGNASDPFRCDLSVSSSVRALGVTKAEWPATGSRSFAALSCFRSLTS